MANINKWGVGKLMEAELPNGKKVYRADYIWYKVGENDILAECSQDEMHFIFELNKLISKKEYEHWQNTLGYIPKFRQGPIAVCSCGSTAGFCDDIKAPEEIRFKLVCVSYLQFGKHQTSFKIKDGKLKLDKIVEQDKLMMNSDMNKLYTSGDE